jgi:hypothetical protein
MTTTTIRMNIVRVTSTAAPGVADLNRAQLETLHRVVAYHLGEGRHHLARLLDLGHGRPIAEHEAEALADYNLHNG